MTDNKDFRLKINLNLKRSSVRHVSSSSSSYSSPIDRTTFSKESLYKRGKRRRRRRIYQTDIQVKDLFFLKKKSLLFSV